MRRREYFEKLLVNGVFISKIIIDPHYEDKHSESINDEIILNLVRTLNGQKFDVVKEKFPYKYFVTDKIILDGKRYKLIWLLEEYQTYLSVINAYRR